MTRITGRAFRAAARPAARWGWAALCIAAFYAASWTAGTRLAAADPGAGLAFAVLALLNAALLRHPPRPFRG